MGFKNNWLIFKMSDNKISLKPFWFLGVERKSWQLVDGNKTSNFNPFCLDLDISLEGGHLNGLKSLCFFYNT